MFEILYNDGELTKSLTLEELKKIFPVTSGILWIDLFAPTQDEIKTILVDLFNFHPLTVEDCGVFIDHPKIDDYNSYLFGAFHSMVYHCEESRVATWEVDFFISKNYLVTNHLKPVTYIPAMINKFKASYPLFMAGPDFIVEHLLDTMINSYYPVLECLKKKLNEVEKEVFSTTEHDTINDIYRTKRNLSLMKRVLTPQIEMLTDIMKYETKYFSIESIPYINDIINTAEKIRNKIKEYNEMGHDTLDAHLSVSSYKMNNVIKRLTVIMTISMPLSIIAGMGGMSEWSMITGASHNNWFIPYLSFTFALAVVGIASYYIFKRIKWL